MTLLTVILNDETGVIELHAPSGDYIQRVFDSMDSRNVPVHVAMSPSFHPGIAVIMTLSAAVEQSLRTAEASIREGKSE